MNRPPTKPLQVLLLYCTAGGGHKSAALAIAEALRLEFGDNVTATAVDVVKQYAPAPFDKVPEAYNQMIKKPPLWKQFYELGDGPRRTKMITSSIALYARRRTQTLLDNHPADVIVSVYHFANAPLLEALQRRSSPTPFITVVTDLVTTPPVWYDKRVDVCVVPTEAARQRGLAAGLEEDKLKVIGLPVAEQFNRPADNQAKLRRRLGWPAKTPVVLLMAGGEGVGPLQEICQAIAEDGLEVAVAVVTGKNSALKARLDAADWPIQVFTYSFVEEMADLMQAADVLVTKAGPGTISEAFCCGLPMILYGRLPGQEEGNVAYVTDEGAGVWAPTPAEVVLALRRWIKYPAQRLAAAATSRSLGRPQAARQIARLLVETVNSRSRPPQK